MRHRALLAGVTVAFSTFGIIAACGNDLEGLTGGEDPPDANETGTPATEGGAPGDGAADSADDVADAGSDAIVDAGFDACSLCVGGPGTTCSAGVCNIFCSGSACSNKAVCAPGLDCTMNCQGQEACGNVSCADGARSCTFDCNTAGTPACNNIACTAPSCLVKCTNGGRCEGTITLGGADSGLVCNGSQACDGTQAVTCDAGRCYLGCVGSCPSTKTCAPGPNCVGDWL